MFTDWTHIEVDLIIADYFSMLNEELKGRPINKTLHRNQLKALLNNRSNGSIEFKHQNISAALIKLGLPFIRGYMPRWNYQAVLEKMIVEYIDHRKTVFEKSFSEFADSSIIQMKRVNFESLVELPPNNQFVAREPDTVNVRRPVKINYLQREQSNSSLGMKGEELVMGYEKWRLVKLGKESLADRIEWVSQHDDGAGFDILSRNENGTDRYIEVKTTKLSKETPIFFSKNEYDFSLRNSDKYHLYRLFNFSEHPKMFNVAGNFDEFCRKEATQYKGYF
jgi:hypothetical protein